MPHWQGPAASLVLTLDPWFRVVLPSRQSIGICWRVKWMNQSFCLDCRVGSLYKYLLSSSTTSIPFTMGKKQQHTKLMYYESQAQDQVQGPEKV